METLQKLLPHNDPLVRALAGKERDGAPGGNFGSLIAEGDGWRALDVICTAGPHDHPFAECHAWESISLVVAGTFNYRGERGHLLIAPGTLILGSVGRSFECSHQYGVGDRCISLQFAPPVFEAIARDVGVRRGGFVGDHIPPLPELAPLVARIALLPDRTSLEEIALELAGAVLRIEGEVGARAGGDFRGVAEVVRHLESHLGESQGLEDLARIAGLSRYHFLRTFKLATGVPPHQWILRARLREAARRLVFTRSPITEIALDVGFEDLSNFIRAFGIEFGMSPREYRTRRK